MLAAVAMTTTVVLAFCIPLARLVRDIARDQAIGLAERDAERVTGALAVTVGRERVASVIAGTEAGGEGRLGIVFPDGSTIGAAAGAATRSSWRASPIRRSRRPAVTGSCCWPRSSWPTVSP